MNPNSIHRLYLRKGCYPLPRDLTVGRDGVVAIHALAEADGSLRWFAVYIDSCYFSEPRTQLVHVDSVAAFEHDAPMAPAFPPDHD